MAQHPNRPRIEVLGAYHLPVTEELFCLQFELLYGFKMGKAQRAASERRCREQLDSTILIELLVSHRDERFRVKEFGQPKQFPGEGFHFQCAWDERFLTPDGKSIMETDYPQIPDVEPLRIAFYVHFWDSLRPLETTYGKVKCPPPAIMPERLARLAPYHPLD